MTATIEISNYPLHADYEPIILNFINRCQESGLKTKVNATSTLMQGPYDEVMAVLSEEVKRSFERYGKMIFVVKILKGELDLEYSM